MDIKCIVLWVIFFMLVVMLYDNWQWDYGCLLMFFLSVMYMVLVVVGGVLGMGVMIVGDVFVVVVGVVLLMMVLVVQVQFVKFLIDVYDGEIDMCGGMFVKLMLKKQGDGKQFDLYIMLFDYMVGYMYFVCMGLFGGDFLNYNDVYMQLNFGLMLLMGDQNMLKLLFELLVKGGVKVVKIYMFMCGSYVIGVDIKIDNVGMVFVMLMVYMEFVCDNMVVEMLMFLYMFFGLVVYMDVKYFQKIDFSDFDKNKVNFEKFVDNGWVVMVQYYFVLVWILQQGVKCDIYVEKIDLVLYCVGVKQLVVVIVLGQLVDVQVCLFVGLEEECMFEGIVLGLEFVKDYGWVMIIVKLLFWLFEKIYGYVGNWGWVIVLLMVLIKVVFFLLLVVSYKLMVWMKEIMLCMQVLCECFKSDLQKMNVVLMELYKIEKVNLFGGCLLVVIQILVFILLYWVLFVLVEMCGVLWILWIYDLL